VRSEVAVGAFVSNWPALHAVKVEHAVCPPALKLVAVWAQPVHVVHELSPALAWYCPTPQVTHAMAASLLNRPAAQSSHDVFPTAIVPAEHAWQVNSVVFL
jgi:hypothetical protein